MPQPNTINIVVIFQTEGASTTINQLNQQILNIGTVAQTASNQATSAFNSMNAGLGSLQSGLAAFNQLLATLGISKLLADMIQLGDEMERIRRAMSLQTGGAEEFDKMYASADRAKFGILDFARAANNLRLAGVPIQEATRDVEALAKAGRLAGASNEAIDRTLLASANLLAKKFATGRELFTAYYQSGVLSEQVIEKATGQRIDQIRKNLQELDVQKFLTRAVYAAQELGDTAKAQGAQETLSDSTTKLKNAFAELSETFVQQFGPSLQIVINFLTIILKALNELLKILEVIPDPVKTAALVMGGLALAILAVKNALVLLEKAEVAFVAINPELWPIIIALGALALALHTINQEQEKTKAGSGWVNKLMERTGFGGGDRVSKEEYDAAGKSLYKPDYAAIEAANKIAENLLDEAQKRYALAGKESIFALTYAYEIHYRKIVDTAKSTAAAQHALATARLAYEKDVATEVLKHHEEVNKEIEKSVHNMDETRRKMQIAQQTMEPDSTFAGRARSERIQSAEEEIKIRHQMYLRTSEEDRKARQQVEDAWRAGQYQQAIKYEEDNTRLHVQLNAEADQAVAANRLEMEKKTLALLREYEKQQREEVLQDAIAAYQRAGQLREAVIGLERPMTPAGQMAQINAMSESRIRVIRNEANARETALREELRIYNEQHPYSDSGSDEKRAEINRQIVNDAMDSNQKIQLDRINAWRDANQIILQEQMQLYDAIKGVVGQIWDAALNKSKSFWESLGNIIKNTMLNALKEIVTSHLAAQFASLLGGGTYQFRTDAMGIMRPPQASGLPNPFRVAAPEMAQSVLITGSANRAVTDELTDLVRDTQAQSATVSSRGSENRAMSEGESGGYSSAVGGYTPVDGQTGDDIIREQMRREIPGGPVTAVGKRQSQMQANLQDLRSKFNIGKPILKADGTTVPWESATAAQKLGSVLKSSGVATLGVGIGSTLALSGFGRGTAGGRAQGIAGTTLTGASLAALYPSMFNVGDLGAAGAIGAGAALGLGLGVATAGVERGGLLGLGMSTGGGALAGAALGTAVFPGLGTLAGAAIGAGVGAIAGIVRLFVHTEDEQIRSGIKRIYGIDIPNLKIRQQIADVIDKQYGGNVNLGLYSTEVQNLVRLYSLSTGQAANLPRPMYSATIAQASGGLQTQPVYSGGQLVQNPYTGTTTTQYAQAGLYMQLNPSMAMQLFSGQVVNVMQQNPRTVAQANAVGVGSGSSRDAQRVALMEPLTVMS